MSTQNKYHGALTKTVSTESFVISITHHKEDSWIPFHAHEKPYLCFSIAGYYEEKSLTAKIIKPGTVLYRNANYEHENQFGSASGICLNIEIKDAERFMLQNQFQLPELEFQRKATINISKLIVSLSQGLTNDILDIQCYESLFTHFIEQNDKGKLKWVTQVMEYINDNLDKNISLDFICNEFQLHPNYIIRKFREVTGYKLSEYLMKIRLEHSIQDLIQTNNSAGIIALDNGFYDQSHFNRSFKKNIGKSPMQFKRLIRG
ncbi:MAG: AraC family transcriptional regulator [Crocinitomicaceae bacterium]|nr:AraC family transcriptional regulator [Crocinitomicaceae bacterium]